MTARISRSPFTYTFHVKPGQKFIRLHIYPSSYSGFKNSNSFFTVRAGSYTLLSNFSASLTAHSLGVKFFSKEFCVNVDVNQALTIQFSPSPTTNSQRFHYAFVNGIEIVPMPTGLYYSQGGGSAVVGESYRFYIDNATALEMVHRLNVGGKSVSSVEDLGMFRSWSEDKSYLLESGGVASVLRTAITIKHGSIPNYVAPPKVHQTAWSIVPDKQASGVGYNLTWKLPVDLGFRYLVRLHFCEIGYGITEIGQREFSIFLKDQTAEIDADVIKWSGGNGVAVYRDYVVRMEGDKMEGKRDLIVALRSKLKLGATQNEPLLSGLEIFKLSNPDNNLAGTNPASKGQVLTSWTSKLRRMVSVLGGGNEIVATTLLVLTLVNIIFYQLNEWRTKSSLSNKLSLLSSSSLQQEICRHFSLAEIQMATNYFDDALVVGDGGFGKVYKGVIDHGTRSVAIKRLKFGSKQGALEFWTEIELLSAFRHLHLVALIGYCDEGQEMLLVYEYMPHGTLEDHLHKVHKKSGNNNNYSPLSWEQRLRICIGAARGLDYLHTTRHGIIHRDVKSSNILLDENWVAKISDFGLSKIDTGNLSRTHISTDIKGTFGYLDPDYYMTRKLTKKSDVYAFGVVLFEVLSGRKAVDTSLSEDQHSLALWAKHCVREGTLDVIVDQKVRDQISRQCLKSFAEIANKCLSINPYERPTMADVVISLGYALERHRTADFEIEEEDIDLVGPKNDLIFGWNSQTSRENSSSVDQNIAKGAYLSPNVMEPTRLKKEQGSSRGAIWRWWWNSLWHREKPPKVKESTLPTVVTRSFSQFSLPEMKVATWNFTCLIASFPKSKVYYGYIRNLGFVVIKWLDPDVRKEFLNEYMVHSGLGHINLISLVGYCIDEGEQMLLYDYPSKGSLHVHLHSCSDTNDALSWKQRLQVCVDAARGLNYLHTATNDPIIHGDVNSHNILLDHNWVAKVWLMGCHCFGLTSLSSSAHVSYSDPEYHLTSTLTEKSDVFSFGIVLFEVFSGRKVIDIELEKEEQYLSTWARVCVAEGRVDKLIDPYLKRKISQSSLSLFVEIAAKCVRVRKAERPSMRDVLRSLERAKELQEIDDDVEEVSDIQEEDGGVLDYSTQWSFSS